MVDLDDPFAVLVRAALRDVTHRGSDVRLATVFLHVHAPATSARSSSPVALACHAQPEMDGYHCKEHINGRELIA